jgi:hypothetical protein
VVKLCLVVGCGFVFVGVVAGFGCV